MCQISVSSTEIGISTRKNAEDIATLGKVFRLNPQPCIERIIRRICDSS